MKAVLQDTYKLFHQNSFDLGDSTGQVNEQANIVLPHTNSQIVSTSIEHSSVIINHRQLSRRPPSLKNINKTAWNVSYNSSSDSNTYASAINSHKKSSNNSSTEQYFDAIETSPSVHDMNGLILENQAKLRSLTKQMSIEDRIDEEVNVNLDCILSAIDVIREKLLVNNNSKQGKHINFSENLVKTVEVENIVKERHTSSHENHKGHKRTYDSSTDNIIRKYCTVVEVRIVFLKIGEIDTLKELYHAEAFIQAKWREPALDDKTQEEIATLNLDKFWSPMLYIDNILTEIKEARWMSCFRNDRGEVYLVEKHRVKGIFLETLELNDFPLDVQDLTITVTTERPDSEIDIIPDTYEHSSINLQTFVDQQEWRLHEHVEISKRLITQEYSSSMRSHPCLSVTCRAARRPGYFYYNVFLIMFMISGLAFATFAVTPDKAELRLRLSFTLVLTSVTFKYVITQSLPKISYLTYMDKYVLMSLAILCIISVWHAFVTLIPYDPERPNPSSNYTDSSNHQRTSSELKSLKDSTANSKSSKTTQAFYDDQDRDDESLRDYQDTDKLQFGPIPDLPLKVSTAMRLTKTKDPNLESFFFVDISKNYTKRIRYILTFFHNYIDQRLHLNDENYEEDHENDDFLMDVNSEECTRIIPYQHYLMLQTIEMKVFLTFVIVYISGHIFFIFWLYFDASKRRREMFKKDKEFRLNKIPVIVIQ